jgi:hypothetical protein
MVGFGQHVSASQPALSQAQALSLLVSAAEDARLHDELVVHQPISITTADTVTASCRFL